jgi:CheY-like chemotaxis protein
MKTYKVYLIVDDDIDDQQFINEALEEITGSCKTYFATNGEEAIAMLRKAGSIIPDSIFLDLNMPRMSGRECLRELKRDPVLSKIPVVIFSTSSARRDKEELLKMGASYFLTKPTDYNALCAGIRKYFETLYHTVYK